MSKIIGGGITKVAGEVSLATGTSVGINSVTPIKTADSPAIDSFGRWRVSNPITLFDSKQLWNSAALFWDDQETDGGGTSTSHSTDEAATTIGVSNGVAGTRVRQTFMRFNYQPGKSQLIFVTFSEFDTTSGIFKAVGYYDDENGLFFESDGGTIGVTRRTYVSGSAVDNTVTQANWNIDSMDGTGPSGVTLDFTKSQIGIIDFEWLGVGRARMGFVVDGLYYYCHEFLNTNNLSTVYMSTPNLPVRYEIQGDGSSADEFVHICSSVISEGGNQDLGVLRSTSTGEPHVNANVVGTVYAIIGIRLKATHLDSVIKLVNFTLMNQTNDNYEWMVYLNPTVAGAFTYNDVTNSCVQIAIGDLSGDPSVNTITGGTRTAGGIVKSSGSSGFVSSNLENAIRLGAAIDGTRDTFVLAVSPFSANSDINGSLTWRELN